MTTYNEIRQMLNRDGMFMMFSCNEVLKAKYEALQWEMRNVSDTQGEVIEGDGGLLQLLKDIQLLLNAMQADDDLDVALNFHAKYIARNEKMHGQEKQIVTLIKQNMKDMSRFIDDIVKTSYSSTYARFSTAIMDADSNQPPRTQAAARASQMLDKPSFQQTILALREHPNLTRDFINKLDAFSLKELEQYRAEMYKQELGSVVKEYDDVCKNKNCQQNEMIAAKNKFIIAKNELLDHPLFAKFQEKIKAKGELENKKVTIFEPEKLDIILAKPSSHSRRHSELLDRKSKRQSFKQHISKDKNETPSTRKPGGRS